MSIERYDFWHSEKDEYLRLLNDKEKIKRIIGNLSDKREAITNSGYENTDREDGLIEYGFELLADIEMSLDILST